MPRFRDKSLGVAGNEPRYDLPLNKDEGTDFLTLLVGLMTFLAVMALAASFALSGVAQRWSSGLENRLTIEIPAEAENGHLRTDAEMESTQGKILEILRNNPQVEFFDALRKEDIKKLLEPWLGKDALLDALPLPGMISVRLRSSGPETLQDLTQAIKAVNAGITLDTHESWLQDFLRLTGALRFATLIVTALIGIATIAAVAGAARSRMAIHSRDVELLHLMGASDEYITRQFQRHALSLSLKGAALGTLAALLALGAIRLFSKDVATSILPDISLGVFYTIALLMTPLASCAIAAFTARFTVLRALARMP